MTLDASNFEERVENVSPSTAGFGTRTGRATLPLFVRVNMTTVSGYDGPVINADSSVTPLDLQSAPQTILGAVNTDISGDGRLNRIMPLAHPQWPWLYASNIVSVRGLGQGVKVAGISPLEAQPMPFFYLYPIYEFVIEFSNRDYAVLPDEDIDVYLETWTDVDETIEENDVAMEWLRFTNYQATPQTDWVVASVGNGFIYETHSGDSPGGPTPTVYPAMPKVLLPNELIVMTWVQVPYRFYSSPNSYLRRFRGRINQFDWYDWKAGELLFMNARPVRYTPPILQAANWFFGSTTIEKWCDLELYFLATRRDGVDLPTPANNNFIAAGHNLLPWQVNNQFYYTRSAFTPPGATVPFPTWTSFPFSLLWTDPDVGIGSLGDAGAPDVIFPDDV